MRQYCVITSDKEDFIVIEKSKLYYADEKRKRLMPVTSDDDIEKYNGSLLLKHGESIKHSMEIIDSDDDITELKNRNSGKDKRIRVFKSAFSPGSNSKNSKKTATEGEKNFVKNPIARNSRSKKTGPKNSRTGKTVSHNSGDYYRSLLLQQQKDNHEKDPLLSEPEMNESDDEETEDSGRNDDNQIENPDPEDEGFEVYDSEGDDLEHTETTPQRSLSDITNTMNSERSRSKKSKVIRREQSKNLRSLTWRRQVDNNFKAINKNLQKLSRNNNLGSHRQSSEKPVNSTSEIPELVEKVTVEDDVE
ncbi:chromatin modification-related protein EAF7-like, partial [Cotesia glomerata]